MKKTIILLAMLLGFAGTSMAQPNLWQEGVNHYIAPGYISGDSIHYIGYVNMYDNTMGRVYADSIAIFCETEDSLNVRYYVVPMQGLATESVADSTAGAGFVTNVATGGYQFTTDGVGTVPWHNIRGAITQTKSYAKGFRIYARVYAVGSEVASSNKRFKTTVLRYF